MNQRDCHTTSESELRPYQQLLLMQYLDGESGLIGRVRARTLLARSDVAREFERYYAEIQSFNLENSARQCAQRSRQIEEIWDRVSARIDQEQRGEIFLGKRSAVNRIQNFSRGLSWWSQDLVGRFGWGLSGAALAGLLAFAITAPQGDAPKGVVAMKGDYSSAAGSIGQGSSVGYVGGGGAVLPPSSMAFSNLAPVVSANSLIPNSRNVSTGSSPRLIQSQTPQAVEVDWMRGSGPLQLIQNHDQESAIIWIKRAEPGSAARSSRPVIRQSRTPDLYDVELSSLESPPQGYFE